MDEAGLPEGKRIASEDARRYALLLIIVVLAAALLRVHAISKESLWFDEACSVERASLPAARIIQGEGANPPFYPLLLHFWIRAFGISEFSLRMLSVIPSLLGIIATWCLGVRFFDERTGLAASCFMAVSSFQIYYAQEARAFAFLLCLVACSVYLMDLALRRPERGGIPTWIAYATVTITTLYTHYYAIYFVAGENLLFLLRWRETRRKLVPWTLAQLVVLAAFLPWFLSVAKGGQQQREHLLLKIPQAFFSFLAGDTLVPLHQAAKADITGTLIAYWPALLATGIGFGIVFAVALSGIHPSHRGASLFLALFLGPVIVSFLTAVRMRNFDERYLLRPLPCCTCSWPTGRLIPLPSVRTSAGSPATPSPARPPSSRGSLR